MIYRTAEMQKERDKITELLKKGSEVTKEDMWKLLESKRFDKLVLELKEKEEARRNAEKMQD